MAIHLQDQASESYKVKGGQTDQIAVSWDDLLDEIQAEGAQQVKEAAPAPPSEKAPPTPDQAPAPETAPPAVPGDGAPGTAPTEEAKSWYGYKPTGEKRTKLDYILDTVTYLTRPLGFLGAATLAPGMRPHAEDESFFEDVYKDLSASGKAVAAELFPTWGEELPPYGQATAELMFGKGTTSQFLAPAIEVVADPGIALGGIYTKTLKAGIEAAELAGQTGKMLGRSGILSRGLMKVFTVADVDLTSIQAKKAVSLAKDAEMGSHRAAQKLNSYLNKYFSDAFEKFEVKSIKREADALSNYHVPLKTKTGQIVTNKYGQPRMIRRPISRLARAQEKTLEKQRRIGSVRLLRSELNGHIASRPFKFRKKYLDINSPKDVDELMLKYTEEASAYVDKAFGRTDASGHKWMNDMLSTQKYQLERELGDKLNMPMKDVEAFGLRILLRDLGSGVKATIAAGGTTTAEAAGQIAKGITAGYKFQELIDHLRFWKLVLARESLRSTLTGTKVQASGAFARINTRAPGKSPAVRLLQVSRAKDALPKPSPDKVQLIADQLERMGTTHATNEYLNKLFSPGGMKLMGDVTPTYFKVLNKTLKWEDQAFGIYIDALLSNPVTHYRNIVDTGSLMLYQDIKEFAATVPGIARMSPDTLMHAQAGMARMHGHLEAVGDMFRIWAKERPRMLGNIDDFVDMHEVMLSRSKPQLSPRALQNASRLTRMADRINHARPTAMLGKADAALKSIEYRAALRAEAVKKAHQISGGDWKQTRKLYDEFVDSPMEQMKLKAFGSAEKYTYQQPFDPQSWFERRILQTLSGTPFVRFTMPFVRTPYQIVKRGLSDGPLAAINPKVWSDILEGGTKADDAIAKVLLSSGGLMYLALHSNEETLTGGVPGVQTARGQWHLENQYEPYSMGTKYERISFENLGPLRWIAGTAANLRDLAYFTDWDSLDGPDLFDRAVSGVVTSIAEPISDSFFLENFTRMVDAFARVDEPGFTNRLGALSQQIALGFATPGAVRATKQIFDEKSRETTNFLEKIMAQVPGLSNDLPEKTDILGHPVTQSYWHKFSPVLLDPKNPSSVAKELRRINASVSDIAKDYRGLVKFTALERAQIKKIRNDGIFPYPGIEGILENQMRQLAYREAPKEIKAEVMQATISSVNKMAMDFFIRSDQALQERIWQAEQEEEERLEGAAK